MPNDSSHIVQRIAEINFSINTTHPVLHEQFQSILETAIFCTGGDSASIMLSNRDTGELHFEKVLGIDNVDLTEFTIPRGEGIAGWVLQNNRSRIVNDVSKHKRFFSRISHLISYKTHTILAVPIRVWDECIGVMEVVNKKEPFTVEDQGWVEILANQAGLAIISARTSPVRLSGNHNQQQESEQLLVYKSETMKKLIDMIRKIALTEASVIIAGESGVGKELVAEQIHAFSPRSEGPLIKVNCPSLPELLLESELFGHVKGAFTDAINNRQGKLAIAGGGTLFLDEIADISLAFQTKLLRVLETKQYEPLGSNQIKTADVRIITASNKNLRDEVQKGRFREDLFYRLSIIPLIVPPLRDRPEDIPLLAEHFFKTINTRMKKNIQGFSSEALEQLINYSWPGNIRELRNSIERAVVLCTGSTILPEDLLISGNGFKGEFYIDKSLKHSLNLFKKHLIRSALLANGWNQTKTAEKLEIQRTYLSRLIKELEIERSSDG